MSRFELHRSKLSQVGGCRLTKQEGRKVPDVSDIRPSIHGAVIRQTLRLGKTNKDRPISETYRRFDVKNAADEIRITLLALFCSVSACAAPSPASRDAQLGISPQAVIAIEHVTVISMAPGAAPVPDVTVIIRGDRISEIGPSARVLVPDGAKIVAGNGQFLIPGLADMHTHAENDTMIRAVADPNLPDGTYNVADVMLPWLSHGVTQIMVMSANAESLAQRKAIESGDSLGPHLALAAMLDGAPRLWPFATEVTTPEAGRLAVRDAHAAGYDFIKSYNNLDLATFAAIVDEAHALDMRVIGHLPGRGTVATESALLPGFAMVAHAEEFAYQNRFDEAPISIDEYARLVVNRGVWLTATLTTNERIAEQARGIAAVEARAELRFLHPVTRAFWLYANPYASRGPEFTVFADKVVQFNRELVVAFAKAGVPILAGTDAPLPGVAPGSSLHDELLALSLAGLENRSVLESATRLPAEFLGVSEDRGTIERGKRADLVLLGGDPLADITNTRRITGVFVSGVYLSAAELDQRMESLADRYTE